MTAIRRQMLDQILSRSMAQSHGSMSECPPVAALAAWFDRALGVEELARLDAHLAICTRCQSILASIAVADEPSETAQEPSRGRTMLELRFVVPALAGILAIVAIARPFWSPGRQVTAQRPAPTTFRADAQLADAASSAENQTSRGADAASTIGGTSRLEATMSTQSSILSNSVVIHRVTPPDHSTEWLIGKDGAIARRDPGSGIQLQQSGVSRDLTAGSALSSRVCWVVGREGTVIRSVDGNHWQVLGAPTKHDLVAVIAHGANDAEVAADNGAEYATTDGGTSWTTR